MAALREQDFDKLATKVVDRFLSGEAKLADAAAEEAMAHGLNPDQIDRLAQSANTQTFLRMMDDRKAQGQGDLMHEFDPIDSRQVIRLVIDNAGVHVVPDAPGMDMSDAPHGYGDSAPGEMPMPPAAPDENEIPDEMSPPSDGPPKKEKAEKDDEDDKKKKKKTKTASDTDAAFRIMRLRKFAGVLQDQFHQTEYAFEETFTNLVDRFKRAHSPANYDAFEKDAMIEHPTPMGVQVLNLIRDHKNLAPLDTADTMTKAAGLADRHVTDETPELHLFETLVKTAEDAQKLQRSLEVVRSQCG